MTPSDRALAAKRAEDLDAADRNLPDGHWEVWSSNSFRRITGPDGYDGSVLSAIKQRDSHLDLSMGEDNLRRVCWLRNTARSTSETLKALLAHVEAQDAHISLVEAREKQATEMCTWLTGENQRLRDVAALRKHLDEDIDDMLEDAEDDCVSRVIAENENARLTTRIAELEREADAARGLVNIHDACRNAAERECDRKTAHLDEAIEVAEWALSVVTGDIPMFSNGKTLEMRNRLSALRAVASKAGGK